MGESARHVSGTSDVAEDIKWMYSGTASIVNREDYLTGRKVDKNFELFSGGGSKPSSSGGADVFAFKRQPVVVEKRVTSVLDLDTVKKEDPLIAIKVKEELVRKEIMENPMRIKRLEKVVVAAMEKKMKKMMKKKRKRSSGSSSQSLSGDVRDRQSHSLYGSKSASSNHNTDPGSQHSRRDKYKVSNRHDSDEGDSKSHRMSSDVSHSSRFSSSKRSFSPNYAKVGSAGRHSDSESEEESRRKSKFVGYGLIGVKKADKPSASEKSLKTSDLHLSYKSTYKPTPEPNTQQSKHRKRQLTDEEKEAKRKEMMENAKWRDSQRTQNLNRYDSLDKEELKRDKSASQGGSAGFMRPLLVAAANVDSVENRLHRNKQKIQRNYASMEKSFARR